jgi:hypothetical protein
MDVVQVNLHAVMVFRMEQKQELTAAEIVLLVHLQLDASPIVHHVEIAPLMSSFNLLLWADIPIQVAIMVVMHHSTRRQLIRLARLSASRLYPVGQGPYMQNILEFGQIGTKTATLMMRVSWLLPRAQLQPNRQSQAILRCQLAR